MRKLYLCFFLIFFFYLSSEAVSGFIVEFPDTNSPIGDDALSLFYYHRSCPDAERIIHNIVKQWVDKDPTLAPAIMRLHFHDCAVRGCDASILLDYQGSERWSNVSKSLRGFEIIDEIKREIEKKCPRTVSCADILTAAARDATVLAGGPYWQVPYGRKDGRVSIGKEAELVPMGRESVTGLVEFYQSKGLNILDLVALSGAHTIGRSTCGSLQYRLYNYMGTGKPDPTITPRYLNYLRRKCRWASEYVDLDANTPKKFDTQYYKNIQIKMGLLKTDQILYYDSRTKPLVHAFASQSEVFRHQFAASMVKLGNIQEYQSVEEGEIRVICSSVND
ncbi:OLC1v1025530C1 [Oldenlandia corymbosa var. corymbosa]|uniref:Peroxidase n=1 Tax=Oldenlandia corymbosa var. corymbosa TaxID=529605 RepID=A0AAV1C755_OLDCO|nr:OLC1v1025530C1 [Oldenlandia corymbosa var. corymbosa]